MLSNDQTSMKFKLTLPSVIEKYVEPLKSIEGIKIVQISGLNRGGVEGGGQAGDTGNSGMSGGASLAEQAMSAALAYRTQAPIVDSLLKEIGISNGSLSGLASSLTSALESMQEAVVASQETPTVSHIASDSCK